MEAILATALSAPRPISSTRALSPQQSARRVHSDSLDTFTRQRRRKPAPQIAVQLSERARRRAATLTVQALSDGQSERARDAGAFDGEASVIQRTPGIMTYKRDATPVYTRDLINISQIDFYV